MLPQNSAYLALTAPGLLTDILRTLTTAGGAQKFPFAASARIIFSRLKSAALPGFPWVADLLMSFPEGTNEGYGPIFSDSRADRALVC